tara:strand:- start:1038 stop:1268 length:231 start_codon:yes stop_codon:yes gene_type:complete
MIPQSMLLRMLKPLLPKLERYLVNQEKLKDDEFADIRLNTNGKKIIIQVIAISKEKNKDGFHEIRQVLQDVDSKDL